MRASVIAIGDELLSGLTVDTNSPFIAESLRSAGVDVVSGFTVADDVGAIRQALSRALEDAELAVTTGGLGPTADDLTTEAVAALAGVELRLHGPSLARIQERFRERGIEMPPNNRRQAMLPDGAEVLPNPIGTAPGFICRLAGGGGAGHIACLPGVPREMERMLAASVLPWVSARNPGRRFATRVFDTFGLTESKLDQLLEGAVEPGEARLSFRAAFPRIQARVTVSGAGGEDLERKLGIIEERIRQRLGSHLFGTGDRGLEEVVGDLLRERGLTLGVAESCTGGLIGDRLTDVPGSSAYFLLGVVAYANAAKRELLGVAEEILDRHGAVSVEVAEAMAQGVRLRAGSDLGLATTGIAGPGGGTAEKPVGTVCLAVAWEGGSWSRRHDLGERERGWIKAMTAQLGLDAIRRHLLGG